jgi:hypothetical protein
MIGMMRALFATCALGVSVVAFAQRGEKPSARARETALSGFPGAFDVFVPKKGSLVLSGTAVVSPLLPVIGIPVEYGLTENLSIGSNLLLPILWTSQAAAYGGKIRLQIPFSSNFVSAYTAWGYAFSPGEAQGLADLPSMNAGLATAAASYFFSERFWMNGLVGIFHLTMEKGTENASSYHKSALDASFVHLSGEYMIASWCGFRPGILFPLRISSASDGGAESGVEGQSVSLQAGTNGNDLANWSFMMDFLPGSHWLISPGVLASDTGNGSGYALDISYRW